MTQQTESKQKKPLLRRVFRLGMALSGIDTMRQIARPLAQIAANNLEQGLQLQQALWARTAEALQSSQEASLHHLRRIAEINTRLTETLRDKIKGMADPGTH
ncbi:hypothetical protein L6R29_10480 [Myxococcota bacterium]|nr:hypothetical protein [Myxococcota bacterium]